MIHMEPRERALIYTRRLIHRLAAEGIHADMTTTGGGCEALRVELAPVPNGAGWSSEILITGGDADLPDGHGVFVGRYTATEEEGTMLLESDDLEHDGITLDTIAAAVRRAIDTAPPSPTSPPPTFRPVPVILADIDDVEAWQGTGTERQRAERMARGARLAVELATAIRGTVGGAR